MKKVYLGTNTKMYKTIKEHLSFVKDLESYTKDLSREDLELFVIPSYTSIGPCRDACNPKLITIGAQNMHYADEGQFTGEISPKMLQEVGAEIIELGHSERRHILGEDDIFINRKVLSAFSHGFSPLLCIGETGEQKEEGLSVKTLRMQLMADLDGVSKEDASNLMVAYEPVWAIGKRGKPATSDYVDKMHREIREILLDILGEVGREVPILFGGSVNNDNFRGFITCEEVNGLFIGRSARDAKNFSYIIHEIMGMDL